MANMNIRPYFDDYDESKGYYRILFRPSYSLQARELTQLQTISQNQISRVGDTILKDGDSLDYGEIKYNDGIVSVSEGVFYINGFAAKVDSSTIGTTDSPIDNSRIGFLVVEEYIEASDDSSLYDNAQGTTNYRAPGADRYKLSLELQSRSIQNSPADLTSDFVEIFRVIDGVVYKSDSFLDSIVTEQKYNEREGENYITDNFDIELSSTDTDYTVKISDGATIIDGREVRIDTPVSATAAKPQDTQKDTFTVAGTMVGSDVTGYVDIAKTNIVTLDGVLDVLSSGLGKGCKVSLKNSSSSVIGEAYITAIRPADTHDSIRVFINSFDFTNGSYTNINSIVYSNSTVFTNLSGFYLNGSGKTVFELPEDYITNISSLSFSNIRKCKKVNITAQEIVLTETDIIDTSSFMVIFNGVVDPAPTYTPSTVNSTQYVLNTNQNFNSTEVYVFYDVKYNQVDTSSSMFHSRTYIEESKVFSGSQLDSNDLDLGVSFVTDFTVMMAQSNEPGVLFDIPITHRYKLDDGQRDSVIKNSKLILRNNFAKPSSKIQVKFNYWKSTNTSASVGIVTSYLGNYDKIPSFNGVSLSDCIDLRPVGDNQYNTIGTITGNTVQLFGKRTDVVSIDKQGSVSITKGNVYKDEETLPDSNGVELYKIVLSPYGKTQTYERIGNKKLSNVELLSIDNRLSKLENQLSISELEQDALISESGSLIHGVLTDPFLGHNIGDISLDDYNVSIDYNENILRPSFVKSFESPVKTDDEKQSSITVSDTPISDVHNLRGYDVIKLTNGVPSTYYGYVGVGGHSQIQPSDSIEIFSDKDGYIGTKKNSIWKDWENSWYGSKIPTNSILDFQRKGDRSISDSYRARIEHDSNIPLSIKGNSGANPTITLDGVDINNNFSSVSDYVINIDNSLSGKKFLEIKSDNYYAANYIHGYGYLSDFEEWGPLQDSISQEFTVYVDSVYTKVDLYLSESIDLSSSKDVYVQIRKMKNGKPSNTVLGTKVLEENNYQPGKNVIEFDKKIPLSAGTYCITVYGSNSSFGLLCSTDYPNGIGNLFVNQTKVADKTLKFNLYKDSYVGSNRTEVYTIDNISRKASIQSVSTTSHRTSAKIILDGHGYSVGDIVQFSCDSSAGLTVYKFQYASGNNTTVPATLDKDTLVGQYITTTSEAVQINTDLSDNFLVNKGVVLKQDGNFIWIASLLGEWKNVSTLSYASYGSDYESIGSTEVIVPNPNIDGVHYNGYWSNLLEGNNSIVYADQSSFIIEDVGYISDVGVIEDFGVIDKSKISLDAVYLKSNQFVPANTSIDWFLNGQAITPNTTNPLSVAMKDDSFQLTAEIYGNSISSPVIDNESLQAVLISNSIDPVTTTPIHTRKDFYDIENNTRSSYISKSFSIGSSAQGLRVNFDALVPSGNHIMVYMSSDDVNWKKLTTPPISRNGKYESLSYYINNESFDSVKIKVLFKGELSENVPKIKNMKIIAVSPSGITSGVENNLEEGSDSVGSTIISESSVHTGLSIDAYGSDFDSIIEGNDLNFNLSDNSYIAVFENATTVAPNDYTLTYEINEVSNNTFDPNLTGLAYSTTTGIGSIRSLKSTATDDRRGYIKWTVTATLNSDPTVKGTEQVTSYVNVLEAVILNPQDATTWDTTSLNDTDSTAGISKIQTFKVYGSTSNPSENYRLIFTQISDHLELRSVYADNALISGSTQVLVNNNGETDINIVSTKNVSGDTTVSLVYRWMDVVNSGYQSELITQQITIKDGQYLSSDDYTQLELSTGSPVEVIDKPTYSHPIYVHGGAPYNGNTSGYSLQIKDNNTLVNNITTDDGWTIGVYTTTHDRQQWIEYVQPDNPKVNQLGDKNYSLTLDIRDLNQLDRMDGFGGGNNDSVEEDVLFMRHLSDLKINSNTHSGTTIDGNADQWGLSETPEISLNDETTNFNFRIDSLYGGNGKQPYIKRTDTMYIGLYDYLLDSPHHNNNGYILSTGLNQYVFGSNGILFFNGIQGSDVVATLSAGDDNLYSGEIIKYSFSVKEKKLFVEDWARIQKYSSSYDIFGDRFEINIDPDANHSSDSNVILSKTFDINFTRPLPTVNSVKVSSSDGTVSDIQAGSTKDVPLITFTVTPDVFHATDPGTGQPDIDWDLAYQKYGEASSGSFDSNDCLIESVNVIGGLIQSGDDAGNKFVHTHNGDDGNLTFDISYDDYLLRTDSLRDGEIWETWTRPAGIDQAPIRFFPEGLKFISRGQPLFYNFGATEDNNNIDPQKEFKDKAELKVSKAALWNYISSDSDPSDLDIEFKIQLQIQSFYQEGEQSYIFIRTFNAGSDGGGAPIVNIQSDLISTPSNGSWSIPFWVSIKFEDSDNTTISAASTAMIDASAP